MKSISLTIDNQKVTAHEGDILLWVALANGFYIPSLCALQENDVPFAGCRLCLVEIEGCPEPITACTETVKEGMVVTTNTPRVQKLQRTAFELILSAHHVDCGHCGKNKKCELQKIAAHLRVKLTSKRFRPISKARAIIDDTHPLFIPHGDKFRLSRQAAQLSVTYDPDKCVLCGKCVWVCRTQQKQGTLNFAYRGFDTQVTIFGDSLKGSAHCSQCRKCVETCPVGALLFKDEQPIKEKHHA